MPEPGEPRGPLAPQYLADQFTLFQLGRADYPHLLPLALPMFFTFRHHWIVAVMWIIYKPAYNLHWPDEHSPYGMNKYFQDDPTTYCIFFYYNILFLQKVVPDLSRLVILDCPQTNIKLNLW